jgi:hypothetical protein
MKAGIPHHEHTYFLKALTRFREEVMGYLELGAAGR